VAERVDELFAEYAAAYARGERPSAREFLARAGGETDELALLIDRFLARAPAPVADERAVELFEAWQAGESPLLRLRALRGTKRDSVVDALVRTLQLDPQKKGKVRRYYHELESGLLDPERVDGRVWDVLAEELSARAADLISWRPKPMRFAASAFARTDEITARVSVPPAAPKEKEEDEIDRLFLSG
jgi:hypothetical protein